VGDWAVKNRVTFISKETMYTRNGWSYAKMACQRRIERLEMLAERSVDTSDLITMQTDMNQRSSFSTGIVTLLSSD
jgi:hypothetical protein